MAVSHIVESVPISSLLYEAPTSLHTTVVYEMYLF